MTRTKSGRSRAGSDSKHDREGLKSRSIYTKKGGGGGSFTWGRPGDEVYIPEIKKGDPNYDSEDEEVVPDFVVSFSNGRRHDYSHLDFERESIKAPMLPLPDFKAECEKAINEYFVEGAAEEFVTRIDALESRILHYELAKKLIVMSMAKSDRERELVSMILVTLQDKKMLPMSQLAKAFERLLENVSDLSLDTPNAPNLLARFLARSVADEILPPVFLNDNYVNSLAPKTVSHAKALLSIKHGLGRLERVWGLGISSSVKDLKREIKMILLEYFSSADCSEVATLLKKMNIPFFHHEVIKRGVVLSLERKEREQAMASVLFKELVKNGVVSTGQLLLGYQRLYQEIEDLALDNPDAKTILDIFADQSVLDGCISREELAKTKKKARENAEMQKKILEEDLIAGFLRKRADSLPS